MNYQMPSLVSLPYRLREYSTFFKYAALCSWTAWARPFCTASSSGEALRRRASLRFSGSRRHWPLTRSRTLGVRIPNSAISTRTVPRSQKSV